MFDDNKTIKFEIVTQEGVVLKEMIHQVTIPTKDGEITILPKHIPLVSVLVPGVIEVKKENGEVEIASVSGGFIEVLRNKVVILADTAERAADLDQEKIELARLQAEESMNNVRAFDSEQFASVSAHLARELARSKALSRWKKLTNK